MTPVKLSTLQIGDFFSTENNGNIYQLVSICVDAETEQPLYVYKETYISCSDNRIQRIVEYDIEIRDIEVFKK